jgi:hypothetical protein
MKKPAPTVGRMVHYRACDGNDYAAIITVVLADTSRKNGVWTVSMTVFKGLSISFRLAVEEGDGSGQWHWPPREEVKA